MPSLSQPFNDIFFSAVSNGQCFVDALFRKKFGDPAPDYGHSVIGFYRKSFRHFIPVCHMNYLQHEEILLSGGAMTDGAAFREMPAQLAAEIRAAGGVYFHLIKYAFDYFAGNCEAFFGYAGDPRALEVDLAAGYQPTPHEHLIVHFHQPLSEERKRQLIAKAHALGPF
jgi:hypothetical protein